MPDPVPELLKAKGPMLASAVARLLVEGGVSPAAARQRVSRAASRGQVHRHRGLNLPNRDSFLWAPGQKNDAEFWEGLARALRSKNSIHAIAADALAARGGIVREEDFNRFSGAPRKLTKQVSAGRVREGLTAVGALHQIAEPDGAVRLLLHHDWPGFYLDGDGAARGRDLAERVVIDGTGEWLRRTGLGAFNLVKTDSSPGGAEFGHFDWALTAPSYVVPIGRPGDDKNRKTGFVTVDVLLGDDLTDRHIAFFLRKVSVLRNLSNTPPFLAVLVAGGYDRSALQAGQRAGVLLLTPDHLFGGGTGAALRELVKTLTNAGAVAAKNPDKLAQLLGTLSKIEGAAESLRGPLFELLTAHLAKKLHGGGVEVREPVNLPDGRQTDVDVLCKLGRTDVWLIECKTVSPGKAVDDDLVKKWVFEQIPLLRAWLDMRPDLREQKHHFEFWTSGELSADALTLLTAAAGAKKYAVGWKDGAAVEAALADTRNAPLRKVFREQFRKHPLNRLTD
ncbi:hypothetical protein [Alienimonas sp. DA493]|uniref:hypothetical protein n=1 Tax=Alienimonas sp. DA493 TaxID=3373605 RepID=UPI003754E90A